MAFTYGNRGYVPSRWRTGTGRFSSVRRQGFARAPFANSSVGRSAAAMSGRIGNAGRVGVAPLRNASTRGRFGRLLRNKYAMIGIGVAAGAYLLGRNRNNGGMGYYS